MKDVGIPDAQLNARKIRRCHLVEIQAGEGSATFYRFTDNNTSNVTVTIDSVQRTFTRQFFVIGQITQSIEGEESTEVTFLDINDTIRGIVHNYVVRRWPASIWECWFDDAGAIVGTEPLIIGTVDGADMPEEESQRAIIGFVGMPFDLDSPGPSILYSAKDFPYAPVAGSKFTFGPYTETVKARPVWQASTD